MYRILIATLLAVGLVAHARAGIVPPAGLTNGQQFRLVFVTTSTTPATSGNVSTYDAVVQHDADAAGLGTYLGSHVPWEAIVSTATVSAVSRLPVDNVPIYLPDGTTEVASGGAQLWSGQLNRSINETASGGSVGGPEAPWTGTTYDGTADHYGGFLGTPTDYAIYGYTATTAGNWVRDAYYGTANALPLFGFSPVLTVGEPLSVPEPGTLALVLVALGSLGGTRLARYHRVAAALSTRLCRRP